MPDNKFKWQEKHIPLLYDLENRLASIHVRQVAALSIM